MATTLFYSPKVLRPTKDEEGNDTSIPGFYWKIDDTAQNWDTKRFTILVSCTVDEEQRARIRTKELFDCNEQWEYQGFNMLTPEGCIGAMMTKSRFGGTVLVSLDNPETEENETEGTPWYNKAINWITSLWNW
jgi:hypothetical protein